jgi:peptidoglycan hydrolase-like amidase
MTAKCPSGFFEASGFSRGIVNRPEIEAILKSQKEITGNCFLDLEDYFKSVIANEMPIQFGIEA